MTIENENTVVLNDSDLIKKHIGSVCKKRREELGLSIEEVESIIIDSSDSLDLERFENEVGYWLYLQELIDLCNVLQIKLSDLFKIENDDMTKVNTQYIGSDFDDFLKEEGILEHCEQVTKERVSQYKEFADLTNEALMSALDLDLSELNDTENYLFAIAIANRFSKKYSDVFAQAQSHPKADNYYHEAKNNISHITKAGENIFFDLGFTHEESKQYLIESLIKNKKFNSWNIKKQLIHYLINWRLDNKLSRRKAASILGITKQDFYEITQSPHVRGTTYGKFTIDYLIDLVARTGVETELVIKQ